MNDKVNHMPNDATIEKIASIIDKVAEGSFENATENAKILEKTARTQLAVKLTPIFKDFVKAAPQDHEGRKIFASQVNEMLRSVGLAIECPKTHRPSILVADLGGREGNISRFRLETRADKSRRVRTWGGSDLSGLNLMPDERRRESFVELAKRRREKSSEKTIGN